MERYHPVPVGVTETLRRDRTIPNVVTIAVIAPVTKCHSSTPTFRPESLPSARSLCCAPADLTPRRWRLSLCHA